MQTRRFIVRHAVALFLCLFTAHYIAIPAGANERGRFPSLDGQMDINAYLFKPEGSGPFPAIVLLHGCGGALRNGMLSSFYSRWARDFTAQGFVSLVVDSAGSRGLDVKKRLRMYRERPFDAYAALAYLQSLDVVIDGRIGLVGWSQGGGVVLLSIVSLSIARPSPPPVHDFAAAAAFYPALCNDRIQSRPFTEVEPQSWSTEIPLLVLQGAADNWTRPEPCLSFIEGAEQRGNPVSIILYDGAYHGFDAENVKIRSLPQFTTAQGVVPIVGTNAQARDAARVHLSEFLIRHLGPENQE